MNSQPWNLLPTASRSVRRYERGDVIFHEGAQPEGAFFVHIGAVALNHGAGDHARPGRIAGSGEILALSSVTTSAPHEWTATALTDCEIGFVERAEFLRTLDETPALWFSVLHILSGEVNAAYDEMRGLGRTPHQQSVKCAIPRRRG